jgi:bifunctional DNA-binding transcriptional regulator/antitoxin component of YhaV-PrlF toxin-antitoxin module
LDNISFISRVDAKGRITIPLAIREVLSMYEGSLVSIGIDLENKSVVVKPIYKPGVLVKVSSECGDRLCADDLLSWVERLDGFRDVIELRCYKGGDHYSCFAIISIDPNKLGRLESSGKYLVEVISAPHS